MSRRPINEGRNSPNRQRATPVELTPVHQRASRRLRGDSPEFASLSFTPRETQTTDAATMTSQVPQAEMVVNQPRKPPTFHGEDAARGPHGANSLRMSSCFDALFHPEQLNDAENGTSQRLTEAPLAAATEQPLQVATVVNDAAAQGVHDEAPISEQQQDDFVATPDGRFHLSNGIYVSANQADKLFKNKKPSILVRDAAQVVWGDYLAKRSVSGRLARTKSGTNEQPAKQLTPSKLNVVYGQKLTYMHWKLLIFQL
ncbi:hypothetical protein HPB50_011228 [Hyalomma asiaticum]|uniref:Uncharacterized protein n=1 Tax=Hyalomma asiaticum TaxID=266040 RepID=A0ACB7SVA8_HYAAI|nr:hypothetical protein HPB50_011228 [Hyalomma asiaticum]